MPTLVEFVEKFHFKSFFGEVAHVPRSASAFLVHIRNILFETFFDRKNSYLSNYCRWFNFVIFLLPPGGLRDTWIPADLNRECKYSRSSSDNKSAFLFCGDEGRGSYVKTSLVLYSVQEN